MHQDDDAGGLPVYGKRATRPLATSHNEELFYVWPGWTLVAARMAPVRETGEAHHKDDEPARPGPANPGGQLDGRHCRHESNYGDNITLVPTSKHQPTGRDNGDAQLPRISQSVEPGSQIHQDLQLTQLELSTLFLPGKKSILNQEGK